MRTLLAAILSTTLLGVPAIAREGMFTPDQVPEIADELREAGLRLHPDALSDMTGFPMGAIAIVSGCSASFVSPQGLLATNHHCARSDVQYISTKDENFLEQGFLAKTLGEERRAQPGKRIFVEVASQDVTDQMLGGLAADLSGSERTEQIDAREKALVERCEADPGHRCRVSSFFGGSQYKLIKRLEIRDVRLVYVPADMMGRYGGEVDDWQWPRHTGDFSFYRAYVAPDGSPADYSADNVPYRPRHHLKVSTAGVEDGDFLLVAGYPGSTSRYSHLAEVRNLFAWTYPTLVELTDGWIAAIEDAAPRGSEARLKYESRLASLESSAKNMRGQIAGARRANLVEAREERKAALARWIAADRRRATFAPAIAQMDALAEESATASRRNIWFNYATNARLLGIAQRLYRLSKERQKADDARETGYQERDMVSFRQRLEGIDAYYDPTVDKAEWLHLLERYMAQPAEMRVATLDKALGLPETFNRATVSSLLDRYYAQTKLGDQAARVALMKATPAALEASDDPFVKLTVALYETELDEEQAAEDRAGRVTLVRPRFVEAIVAWQRSRGLTPYPDANSTLRITFGKVFGGSPEDGLIYEPFTRLEGIAAKDTGVEPFDAPDEQLALIGARDYGTYAMPALGSVPVNFLSDLDVTGGNSGSPTLNARGELVGLLFDMTLASVNSDWNYNPRATRAIHVDARYMLWTMEKLDGAKRLIEEMEIVR